MPRQYLFFFLTLLLVSCDSNSFYASYKPINESWKENQQIKFNFKAPDTINKYNLFLLVRNDEKYAFSNLYLIVNMNFPNGDIVTDTLQYAMAKPDGTWLGKGLTSLKESKLWYKENIVFPAKGDYKIQIEHAMRINGKVDGIKALKGIKDIGFKVETTIK